jgi:hypothetical protein
MINSQVVSFTKLINLSVTVMVTEEKAIAACKIQRDKATEERGGSTDDILSRPNLVWIPGPDYYCG